MDIVRRFHLLIAFLVSVHAVGVRGQYSLTNPISCYTCSTGNNPGCEDSHRISSWYQGCPAIPGQDRCVKIVGPGLQVTRRCGGLEGGGQLTEGCFADGEALVCICSSNYCNGDQGIKSSGILWTIAFFVCTGFFRRLL